MILKSGNFKLHKKCYDKFNNSKLDRAKSSRKRRRPSESDDSRLTRGQCSSTVHFGEELCMYFGTGAHKDEKHSKNYVDNYTCCWW